jgi:hypothetical protein
MALSIEEKYDEVRQLIAIGKEKGYLLYEEVNEMLPADITSSDELDDLFSTFGNAGIEVVDSEKTYREEKLLDRTGEGAEEIELDLTPGALDKTNDPVRMYLREMGTVPLLTREGEVEIAKRIERGKLAVIKSISRTPTSSRPTSAASASWSSSPTKRSPTRRSNIASGRSSSRSKTSARRGGTSRRPRRSWTRRPRGRPLARRRSIARSAGSGCGPASSCLA